MIETSIVMTYYNRTRQLRNSLKSIRRQKKDLQNTEIIIVDDASDEEKRARLITKDFKELNIQIVEVKKEEKYWINPCVPYNMGFRRAKGKIIVIQNPECVHFGRILGYAKENIGEGKYLSFPCYYVTKEQFQRFCKWKDQPDDLFLKKVSRIIDPLDNRQWYNHSSLRPTGYHFTSVILKKDLDRIGGGFNEDFATGYCFDDDEFLFRLDQGGMDRQITPHQMGFVIHQWHPKSSIYVGRCPEWYRNRALLEKITGKEYKEI